ncbi:MAG: acetate/propionate family kinase [Candidatus Limnocylindrales bacterium]
MRVLVLNPGSSSLKAAVLEPPDRTPLAAIELDLGPDASRSAVVAAAVAAALDALLAGAGPGTIDAVGYRVVHGGTRFVGPALIDDEVVAAIDALGALAPLHNPLAAAAIRAARVALPHAIHVAAFDTAFHAALPEDAVRYAVPSHWAEAWGVRRYGFHGLSVAWSTRRVAELLERPVTDLRLVVAQLGSGCSVTAVAGGRSVETSMGMTPLEGLVMGTRAGSLDPGIIIALLRDGRRSVEELAEDLDHRSGLVGLSGRTSDVRELLAAEATGDQMARLALAVFVRRAAAGIAAAATALDRLDAIVFTGGIGAHAGPVRRRILDRLAVVGVERDPAGGFGSGVDHEIADAADEPTSGPAIVRIAAREDVVIAEQAASIAADGLQGA